MKKYLILIFTLLTLLFASCSNGLDDVNPVVPFSVQGTVTVTGNLSVSGAFPEEIAGMVSTNSTAAKTEHTAIPGAPGTFYTYVWAEKVGDSAVKFDATVTGSTYTIAITAGAEEVSYKMMAKAYIASSQSSLLLLTAESTAFTISSVNTVVSRNLELQASSSTGGTGILSLTVTKASDSNIASAKATYKEGGTTKTITATPSGNDLTFTQGAYSADNTAVTSGVTSGYYNVTFDFYSGADCTGELLYSFVQGVNIFDNLITNIWVKNGGEPHLKTTVAAGVTTTTCEITKALVDDFATTVFYLAQGSYGGNTPANGATGTLAKPFSSITYALEKMNDPTKDYKIYSYYSLGRMNIKPTQTQIDAGQDIQARSITIIGIRGLPANGVPYDTIDGTTTASAVIINTAVPVTFKRIKIQDGNANNGVNDTNRGGGIDIENSGAVVTLDSDVYLCGNYATKDSDSKGGGIYVCSGATLNLKNGVFIGKKQDAPTYTGENRAVKGGAIYNAGTVNMYEGATLRYARVLGISGSGCYGGGIYCASGSSFNMYGGTIDYCLSGSDNVSYDAYGGGLYIEAGSSCNLYGGEIKNCYSKNPGAAVCYENANLKMKGAIHIPKGGANTDSSTNSWAAILQNDLHNKVGTAITIEGDLTAHSESDKILLTPINYNSSTQLLSKGSGLAGEDFRLARSKIELVPQESVGDSIAWYVNNTGNMFVPIGSKSLPDAVGDIVYNDGSADPADISDVALAPKKASAIAVICYKSITNFSDHKLLGIGLKQVYGKAWCSSGSTYMYTELSGLSSSNGMINLEVVKALSEYSEYRWPAFYWVDHYSDTATNLGSYNSGWYLPAGNELRYWRPNYSTVKASMEKIGSPYADLFEHSDSGNYLSSSQYDLDEVYYVNFYKDQESHDYKTYTDKYIRAIHNFIND
ncbi:MAG: hypothetical protein K6A15_09920 [Treponema sp.]|nr:hypothetical protein [Treponema sp.]